MNPPPALMLTPSVLGEKAAHEQLFVQTLEQAVDAVIVIDEHDRVAFFNPAAERLWGWPRAQVLGQDVGMLMPPGLREAHGGYLNVRRAACIDCAAGAPHDVPVQRRDGTRRWASMSVSRVAIGPRVLYTAFLKDATRQRAQQQRLRQLSLAADRSGSAVAVTGADLRIAYVNAGFTRLLGYDGARALGRHPGELLRGPHTDAQAVHALHTAAATGLELQTPLLVYANGRRALWASATVSPVHGAAGALEHVVLVLADITHARIHEELQHKVLDAMAHGAPLRDAALLLCREVEHLAPEAAAALLELDAGGRPRLLAAPSLPPEIERALDGAAIGQPVLTIDIATDPHWAPVREVFAAQGLRTCRAHPVQARDGAVLGVLALCGRAPRGPQALGERLADAALRLCALLLERERERAHIHQLAYRDALTGLANRSMLHAQAARMLHEAQRSHAPLALLFIDLDRFKQVNDTQGHLAGDALLRAVAERLQASARASDLAARMGGDEFVLLLTHCDARQAALTAERLLAAIGQPVHFEGATLHPRASVGIAMFPENGSDADALLHCADLAMYQAKAAGSQRWRFHSAEMNDQAQALSLLESGLREALRIGALALHYQPQMRGATLHGVQALPYWTHPLLGPIAPDRLARTAEECGLQEALARWMLEEACRQMAGWRAHGVTVPRVAVGLQARSLLDPGLPELLARTLAAHGLRPADLVAEVAESALCAPDPAVLTTARGLRERGIAVSLAGFGTGHCSLGALHLLPIDELKLDQSFVQGVEASATARALASAMLHIARGLGLPVVAEGVQTPAQRQFLRTHGCAVLQGSLLSQPLPADALPAWLRQAAERDA